MVGRLDTAMAALAVLSNRQSLYTSVAQADDHSHRFLKGRLR